MCRNQVITMLSVVGLLASLAGVAQGDVPPEGSKPLSAILKSIEAGPFGRISEIEFDDGLWEAKVCGADGCVKLYLDPRTGQEQRRRKIGPQELPPEGSKPISGIVASLEARELGTITEVEFEEGSWEVKLRKDGRKVKLLIDPATGQQR